MLETELNRLIQ